MTIVLLWRIKYFSVFLFNLTLVKNETLFLFQISPFYENRSNLHCTYRNDFFSPLNRSSWMHDWITKYSFIFFSLRYLRMSFFFCAVNLQSNLKSSWQEPLVEQSWGSTWWARSPLQKVTLPRAWSDFSTKAKLFFPTLMQPQQCPWCWKGLGGWWRHRWVLPVRDWKFSSDYVKKLLHFALRAFLVTDF